jgi:ABC-2 type transport system permease protein
VITKKERFQGAILLLLVLIGLVLPFQCDLTADQRYTLTPEAKKELAELNQSIKIDVFLAGKLPPTFQRLRREIETVLTRMNAKNKELFVEYIDPFDTTEGRQVVMKEMQQYGLIPQTVVADNNQSIDQTVVFPWAIVSNGKTSVRVSLWQKNMGDSLEDIFFRSVSQLEYQFLDGIKQLTLTTKKNLAVLTSHKTSEAILLADFLQSLKPYYNLASFDLKALPEDPAKTLDNLNRFDLLLVSNPNSPFSSKEKFILDQYQMQGGNTLWMVDALALNRDSLFNKTGRAITFPKSLDLEDYFFKQGLRINKGLLSDLYCAPIVMAQGTNEQTQYMPYPWTYYPIPSARAEHPISKGVGNVLYQFTTPIDTLANGLKKTVLTASSPLNKILGVPVIIALKEATKAKNPEDFQSQPYPLSVLVEGTFESLFTNRIAPFKGVEKKLEGRSKTLLISDGNFAENQLDKGQPLALGYDKWTHNFYQNKLLLQNAVHYLMGNSSWVNIRTKAVEITLLDKPKVLELRRPIQLLSLAIPLIVLLLSAFLFRRQRRAKLG